MHATKIRPDPDKFKALPKSIACASCHDDETGAFYIFTEAARKDDWLFGSMPPEDIPLDLPVGLEPLNVLYEALPKVFDRSFERRFVNLNLLLSQIDGNTVCSLLSDDDSLDFACISTCGRLDRLRFEAGDLEILYSDGGVVIQPLRYRYYDEGEEFEDTDVELTDLGYLNDSARNICVLPRNKDHCNLMRLIVSEELAMFLSVPKSPLDLGSFDIVDLLHRIGPLIEAFPKRQNPERKPWWKVWR